MSEYRYDPRVTSHIPVSSVPFPDLPEIDDEEDEEDIEEENRARVPATQPSSTKGQTMNPILERSVQAHRDRVAANMPKVAARNAAAASTEGTASQRWDNAVAAEVARGKSKADAIRAVNKAYPGLREQMLAEVNNR